MKTLILLSMIGSLALGTTAAQAAELKPGDAAPNFTLQGSDGKTYKLSDFKGKQAVVVAWFPKAFTGGCTAECKSMRADGAGIRKYDVAYFTASVDSVEGEKGNAAFAKSLDLDFPILSDPKKETAGAYGVLSDRGFANRWTFYIGKDGKILHVDKAVKAAAHGADIAAKLKELGVAEKK
jgi:peroxiredoxin Q/BCP